MSDAVTIGVVASICTMVPLLTAQLLAWRASAQRDATTGKKVDAVHALANGRLTEALQQIAELKLHLAEMRERSPWRDGSRQPPR